MNFFEHQEQARRQSRWLVFLFLLAVLAIIAVIDLAILVAFGAMDMEQHGLLTPGALQSNWQLLVGGAIVTALVVALASLFKTVALRSGGGKVARDLGGVRVEADSNDPLRRRLYHVVEEIALASGIPVPEIYVLEQESAINAFAAGYSPADAAVAVTRGALEKLDRNELQGVIAHEFSHIFNGDMRLNIRLMGALFGILMLSLIGRRVLHGSYYVGRSRNSGGNAVLLIALVITLVGYIGLFFGRWIKSAVSRQREYLADASAVQFTRDPDGVAGALKKIAVYSDASYLNAETEEVSHMLFGAGEKVSMFATHPPLNERIGRIDRSFEPADLKRLAADLQRRRRAQAEIAEQEEARAPKRGGLFDADDLVGQIGNPDFSRLLMAAALAASIPSQISKAAHSGQWATEVLLYSLVDANEEIREQQLLMIAQKLGSDTEARVCSLLDAAPGLAREQRLPLLEIAIPELKRRPPDYVANVLATVTALSEVDGETDMFEYLMAKIIAQHLWESQNPHSVRMAGRKTLKHLMPRALKVVALVAVHGQQAPGTVERAWQAGLAVLGEAPGTAMPDVRDWTGVLNEVLPGLDALKPADKQQLVKALIATVSADNALASTEMELLRVVCLVIHVPLPMISGGTPKQMGSE